ncbi:Ca-transporting ATPase [Tilletiaria anomala UBC 951]|uniref:Calcium-transporting ATPase n=1 Tax=Tilletiaria anomala (strain ATCC 24038 / CBS 436.72 / UBC 951) TaxID=1037660 RepID=A0A066VU20_TILAU|nr:Ca-transporting ATPase [Tilletiaria anomala UBC 951]KDN45222.1 Ca-transporting ATPase [Tilletiaria anomala UBC 951]
MDAAWTHTVEECIKALGSDAKKGLSSSEIAERHTKYGKNALPEQAGDSLFKLILDQFKDQLVLILLASAVISFVLALLEEYESLGTALIEPGVIFLILIANATVGVVQERNAEESIEALKKYSPDNASVVRDGSTLRVKAEELVPGDILVIAVGDKVPADCRLIAINSSSFRVDQAILTGESIAVNKDLSPVADARAVKQDMTNTLFSGTTIVSGSGVAIVVRTGEKTAIGDIHAEISQKDADEKTPLKQKLDEFGDMLAKVISVICILVWLVNIRHFSDASHHGTLKGAIYYFKIAVALAVAAIPEGLAAVITACLALGTKKMAAKNAIVRHLPSVETLGSTNVICSDKTGTLTTNQMSVTRFLVFGDSAADVREFDVEGSSYAPEGAITSTAASNPVGKLNVADSSIQALAEVAAVCNDAQVVYSAEDKRYNCIGQPTEAALKVLVEKIGHHDNTANASFATLDAVQRANAVSTLYQASIPRLLTLEFSRDRKSMSVLIRRTDNSGVLLVKGAPETVLDRCSFLHLGKARAQMTPAIRNSLNDKVADYATRGLRCLVLAVAEGVPLDIQAYKSETTAEYARYEQNMTFVGLVGMLDPPRPEVRGAIERCRSAGIRVIVITGDNKNTAETICRQIGVFGDSEDLTGKSYTGREFDELDDQAKRDAVLRASLFSRTEPTHKSQLVDLLQEQGLVVAMTGDGVNDAPALKKADIGIAMGTGTDVAKSAADMVLADDNFATIETAVEEGRSIYNNMQSFIRYLISSNIGEVVSIFLTVLLGMPEALIPVQLLWVNLVTDGLPATALGFNPPDHEVMRHKPRRREDPLVSKWLFIRYLLIGTYVGVATVGGYAWWFMFYEGGPQISFYQLTHFHQCGTLFPEIGCEMFVNELSKRATTISLSILVTIEMFNALNSLSEEDSLLVQPPTKNPFLIFAIVLSMALHFMILYTPFLRELFVITPLNWAEWKGVLYISAPVILIDEVCKWITRTFVNPPTGVKKLKEA